MPESEEESVRRRVRTKILVRTPRGDLWLVRKGANPKQVHSIDRDKKPHDPRLVKILEKTDAKLADHFRSANPGVKLQIAVVDLDAPS